MKGSLTMMNLFTFIIGESVESKCYKNLYPLLNEKKEQWKDLRTYGIKTYLHEMTKLGPRNMKTNLGGEDNMINTLNLIYSFLSKYYSVYIEQSEAKSTYETGIKIILTQSG
jgi:hypothetical protein